MGDFLVDSCVLGHKLIEGIWDISETGFSFTGESEMYCRNIRYTNKKNYGENQLKTNFIEYNIIIKSLKTKQKSK